MSKENNKKSEDKIIVRGARTHPEGNSGCKQPISHGARNISI